MQDTSRHIGSFDNLKDTFQLCLRTCDVQSNSQFTTRLNCMTAIPLLHDRANIDHTSSKYEACIKHSLHEAVTKQTSNKHRADIEQTSSRNRANIELSRPANI